MARANPGDGVRVLSLDGPPFGPAALSEPIFLQQIAYRWAYNEEDEDEIEGTDIRVSDMFDFIGGSGMGGLYAILFARLNMTIGQVIEFHNVLQGELFMADCWVRKDRQACTKAFDVALDWMVSRSGITVDLNSPFFSKNCKKCFIAVLNETTAHTALPRALRTYKVRASSSPRCTIRQAFHATLADLEHLPAISIGDEQFTSASGAFPNASRLLVKELTTAFSQRDLACFVNLGADCTLPKNGSHLVGQDLLSQFQELGCFFRLSLREELHTDSRIISLVMAYLQEEDVSKIVDEIVDSINGRDPIVNMLRLGSLAGKDGRNAVQRDISYLRNEEEIKRVLKKIRAPYDFMPIHEHGCLEGTRAGVLKAIEDWADDVNAPNVFWLEGYPGTGKTAISITLKQRLAKAHRLGASCFFRREDASHHNLSTLFRSIACQLASNHNSIRDSIFHAVNSGAVTLESAPSMVFEQLICHPLATTGEGFSDPIILVLDAMDEYGRSENDRMLLIELLLPRWVQLPPQFKLFIASRSQGDLPLYLDLPGHMVRRLDVGNATSIETRSDIRRFFEYKFGEIRRSRDNSREFVTSSELDELVVASAGLFIWASTVVEMVSQMRKHVWQILQDLRERGTTIGETEMDPLHQLYSAILQPLLKSNKYIIGFLSAVISAKTPLSAAALSLMCMLDVDIIEDTARQLRPLMDTANSLRFVHKSFVDYVLSRYLPVQLTINKAEFILARSCFQVMYDQLNFNMDEIPASDQLRSSAPEQYEALSEELQYALRFWGAHLTYIQKWDKEKTTTLAQLINHFFNCRFLYWLEVVRILGFFEEAIDCAIDSQLHIVQITHDGHPYKTMYLGCLGTSLQRRFERFGEMDDIDRAIKFQLEAFDLTLDGHPEKLICLSNLGNFCLTRFKRIGELADIDKAIGFQLEAVDIAPDDHLDKPMYLSNLGNSFLARFQRLGEMVDVEKAIKAHRSAVQLTPNGHPSEPVRFSNLGNSHLAWFQHFGEMKDIERAIEAHLRAVELTPYGHPDKPMYFGNLGNSHLARFQSHGEMSDIDKAVDSQLNAIRLTPDDHPDKPMYLDNLGNSHLARFQHLGEVDDTDKAIEAHLSAVELTPNGHSNKPIRLSNLGTSYLTRFECLGEMKDIDAGIIVFELSATSLEGPPVDKFRAARKWISTLRLKEKTASIHGQGLQPQHTLISLIPDLVWLGTPVHQSLQTIQDVIASSIHEVVSDAIRAQELELAVEWMERGRSIIWSQLRRLRSPLVDLQDSCPSLAQEFQDVQRRIEMSFLCHEMQDKGESELSSLEHQRQNHRRDTQRRDELLAEIRSKHGFERFLMPETFSVLSKACQGHLVVLLTVFEEHCDALIILPSSSITHLSFTEVTQGEINRLHAWWDSSDKDDSLAYLLSYVWTKIVQPIIEEIESVLWHLANDNVARIIWCPSGPLSFLPLHAAGNYGRDPQDHIGISDFAVSSYTPSLMALLSTPVQLGPPSMLLVTQPCTPQQVPLPGAIPEAENIMQKAALNNIQPYIHHLSRSQATVSAVIKHLKSHSWVHLACHGVDKYPDPMESSFHLHDGCLTLAMLMQNSIRNAQFAFLSACQTATGERTLSDESMHLTSGMLAAGFPSVVGTMWSIQDTTTPEVAEAFYAVLFEEGQKSEWKMKPEPAYALHFALRSLRAQGTGDRQLMKWVPFVHYGI